MNGEEHLLLYNARTNALATLDSEHTAKYNRFLETRLLDDEDFKRDLEKGGYILEDDISELELLRLQLNTSRYGNNILSLTIAATADCNFRCIYCYEKNSIMTSKMTIETQEAIVNFIKRQIKTLSVVQICWYGGEPLLAFDVIEYLSPQIIAMCDTNNVAYHATIVSNGYLLTPTTCELLKANKVGSIQVTLDGPEEIHNKRRPLAGGKGTFKKIIDNLKECSSYFESINIRVNTDSENFNYINSVKSTLEDNGILKSNVNIYLGFVEDHNNAYEIDKCLQIDRFSKTNLEFIKSNKLNIMALYPRLFTNFCGADLKNSYVIDSKGYLYKCWNDVGIEERNVGHITDTGVNTHECKMNLRRYLDFMLFDPTTDLKCTNCKCLPICMGGCPYKRVREPDSDNRCINQKFMLEEYIRECAEVLLIQQSERKE